MRIRLPFALFCVAFSLIGLSGCSDSTDPEPASPGHIRIHLVDRPEAYDAVNIVVDEVSVHMAGSDSTAGWMVIDGDTHTFDLLLLTNGVSQVLADEPLAPGHYTQIRLKLGEGSNVVVDGEAHPLDVPSGLQSGLKLNHPFDIVSGALYELTLDFDAARSIHQAGNDRYILSPVIRLVANQVSGTISGLVSPAAAGATVSATSGADTASALADPSSGAFKLMALPAGTYVLHVAPVDASYRDATITDVTVIAGQDTDLGTIALQPR